MEKYYNYLVEKVMIKYFILLLFILGVNTMNAQTTINTYTVWGTPGVPADFVLNNGNNLTVNDTLVVYGNLELRNDADITINTGGVLIIIGDFLAFNKVDLAVGGVLVVTGNFDKTGGQGEITDDGGDIYIFDDTPEWGSPPAVPGVDYGDEEDIINDPIIDIIGDIISSGCSLSLSLESITHVTSPGGNDGAIDITVTGNTAYNYTWSTSNGSGLVVGDEDQTGLTAGMYAVAVQGTGTGATCYVFGSYTVREVSCTEPTITGTTPGSRCGTGTVTLGATASAGTINWYNVVSGGSSLGAGTSFPTPSIAATTTYYVDATDAGCTTASRTAVVATVNPLPIATIAFTAGNGVICNGDDTQLEVTVTTGTTDFDITVGNNRNAFTSSVVGATSPWTFEPGTLDPGQEPVWIPTDGASSTYTYTITTITDAIGCTATNVDNVDVEVYKIPETGPQYHIENTWGN